jgi:hypothetical protein
MAKSDLHNNIDVRRGISPVAATTDNTAYVSQIVDTRGYESVQFITLCGSLADVDVTSTCLVEHGDAANLSDAAAVPDDMLLGLESQAAPTFASDDRVFKIGYVGPKRYVRVTITPAANSGNIFMAGVWVLGHPALVPTPNPPV